MMKKMKMMKQFQFSYNLEIFRRVINIILLFFATFLLLIIRYYINGDYNMEIYIDIVYVINCILDYFCILSLCIITGKIISIKKGLLLSFFWGLHVFTLYTVEWLYFVWGIIVVSLFEKKHIVRNYVLLLIIHETFFNSLSGVYRIGNVIVVTSSFEWLLPLLIGILIIFLYLCLLFQFRREVLHQQLVHDVIIRINGATMHLKGFMDTGNLAVIEGVPIVFLKDMYIEEKTSVFIDGIRGKERFKIQKGEIYFNEQWKKCAFSSLERLDISEDCLLNYYLL